MLKLGELAGLSSLAGLRGLVALCRARSLEGCIFVVKKVDFVLKFEGRLAGVLACSSCRGAMQCGGNGAVCSEAREGLGPDAALLVVLRGGDV